MNLQQLRYLRETARRGLHLTQAAAALHTSQPGLSKAIRELEDALGVQVFVRHGKRLTAITDEGHEVLAIAERLLTEAENLKSVGRELRGADTGVLRLAATHTQARYVLPPAVLRLREAFPGVRLQLRQAVRRRSWPCCVPARSTWGWRPNCWARSMSSRAKRCFRGITA